jgi:pyruvate-formate lyase
MGRVCFYLLALFLLGACDPAQYILIKNRTGKPITMIWTTKLDSLTIQQEDEPDNKRNIISLGVKAPEKDALLYFGQGRWTDQLIDDYIEQRVESIEWIGLDSRIEMREQKEIQEFLKNRKSRLSPYKIVIILR